MPNRGQKRKTAGVGRKAAKRPSAGEKTRKSAIQARAIHALLSPMSAPWLPANHTSSSGSEGQHRRAAGTASSITAATYHGVQTAVPLTSANSTTETASAPTALASDTASTGLLPATVTPASMTGSTSADATFSPAPTCSPAARSLVAPPAVPVGVSVPPPGPSSATCSPASSQDGAFSASHQWICPGSLAAPSLPNTHPPPVHALSPPRAQASQRVHVSPPSAGLPSHGQPLAVHQSPSVAGEFNVAGVNSLPFPVVSTGPHSYSLASTVPTNPFEFGGGGAKQQQPNCSSRGLPPPKLILN